MPSDSDPRTVLQAHKLRTQLAATALTRGSAGSRGRDTGVKVIIVSIVLAAVVLGGIVIAGFVIDLIQSGGLTGRRR